MGLLRSPVRYVSLHVIQNTTHFVWYFFGGIASLYETSLNYFQASQSRHQQQTTYKFPNQAFSKCNRLRLMISLVHVIVETWKG